MVGELVTRRLVLGPWRDDDLTDYTDMVRERDQRTAAAQGEPSRDELHARIRKQQTAIADTGIGLLTLRVDRAFIGYCGLVVGRSSLDEPELAYELLRAHHGNGYATEAASAIVDATAETGRSRLWATVRPWNEPSLRVLDKLAFERTATVTTDEFGDVLWLTRTL
ncbi:MAG TPA: GNAT family N-acetyltransferase [Jatrophihabitans sp.]|nr:GNAT family N-acetyltransferase [Jatrophihabitans sp.]